jgi:hypothetical protein
MELGFVPTLPLQAERLIPSAVSRQGDAHGEMHMAESNGSGMSGLLAGLVIAALLVVGGFFLFNGGFGGGQDTNIKVEVPEAATPG